MFRWRSTITTVTEGQPSSVARPPSPTVITSVGVSTRLTSSNNVLNSNLSGSFKDSDDETQQASIYEPQRRAGGNGRASSESSIHVPDRRIRQQPVASSSSSQGRLGVVALPNMEFSPSPPDSKRNTAANEFIV